MKVNMNGDCVNSIANNLFERQFKKKKNGRRNGLTKTILQF